MIRIGNWIINALAATIGGDQWSVLEELAELGDHELLHLNYFALRELSELLLLGPSAHNDLRVDAVFPEPLLELLHEHRLLLVQVLEVVLVALTIAALTSSS